ANLEKIKSFGNEIIEARDGELASGLVGQGRMAEPEELLEVIKKKFDNQSLLKSKKVLITSGPTHEAIDPVRFIGNHSSGKMGKAIAESFASHGAEVTMISGPSTNLPEGVKIIKIKSAEEMLSETRALHDQADIIIFSAAVADYRPENPAQEKIKKQENNLQLNLIKNPDIALELGKQKKKQIHVGFALETNNESSNAKEKLKKKNFDLIVLNSLNDTGAGFQSDTNKVSFFDKNDNEKKFELKSKQEVAADIVSYVTQHFT
ncbi:MAG: bifunctional phosphopantothenoylcysteine decarboxylase/phosphopantothenate--cysteine ligase CoaBC, partial [Ekhidna sp.]